MKEPINSFKKTEKRIANTKENSLGCSFFIQQKRGETQMKEVDSRMMK